jgi:hypothetical protein
MMKLLSAFRGGLHAEALGLGPSCFKCSLEGRRAHRVRAACLSRARHSPLATPVRDRPAGSPLASPRLVAERTGRGNDRIRDRKRWREFGEFCRQLRRRFPTGRHYLICDNYGPHHKAEVRTWCAEHGIELVFTPTNASWLNWIEAEFTALRYFTLDGSDYLSHAAQELAIARYIRW